MPSQGPPARDRSVPTKVEHRQLDSESSAPSPSPTPLKPAKLAINAGVGVCIALGISVILSALLYLSPRRRRHLRRIQAQEQREADAAVIEEAKHSASASRGSPVPPPVTAREWLVSDERAWRAELRKELEADVRQLKREEKARDKDSILMVEDINKPWKGKMKVTS